MISNLVSYERLEWNLKFWSNVMQIKCNEITFNSWKFSSYNFLTQEHCKLITFKLALTFLRPPVSTVLYKVLCVFLTCNYLFKNQIKFIKKYLSSR